MKGFSGFKSSPAKQTEKGYVPNEEDSKKVQEEHKKIKEKAAKTDWDAGSTLKEGDYATYGQQAYDHKGNKKKDYQGHGDTGEVLMDQKGRPYSEQEGTDELVFWSSTNKDGSPMSPAEDPNLNYDPHKKDQL